MTEAELDALVAKMNGKPGDLLLFAADKNKIVWNVLGALRLMLGAELGLIDENKYNFLWVTEFPLLEWSDEKTDLWQCIIHSLCLWRRIGTR